MLNLEIVKADLANGAGFVLEKQLIHFRYAHVQRLLEDSSKSSLYSAVQFRPPM